MVFLYLCFLFVFPAVHYLYGLAPAPTAYTLLIITFLLFIYAAADYAGYRARMRYLHDINSHLSSDKLIALKAGDAIEEEYLTMVSSLYEIVKNQLDAVEKSHTEQMEYYTMWVHQIKTPISAMRLALQSMEASEHLSLLGQELFKIEQYVELALQYNKLKELASDLVIREYALEEIVNQSVKKYAPLFIYKKLSVTIDEFHAAVNTDSKWLSFILEQLLSNAIKYTNQGGIRISFEDNTLRILDTGIGIRAEDMERLFEKGFTGYNGRVDKKASGIGLYLAKQAADSLALKLAIHSKVGEGTTVFVDFPKNNDLEISQA
jgi:signal transduction histidine kinase